MDENLQRLIGQLRNEVCPQRVRDEVARHISSQELPAGPFRYAMSAATATLLILCGLVIWRWPQSRHTEPRPALAQPATVERARVIAQAEGALGYVGNALLRAGARSEIAVNKEAVDQLRNRFESATDKIIQLLNQ
jgi:hypothetical protein